MTTALLLMVLGWGGVYALLMQTTPDGGTRWALFFCGFMAVTGTALPLTALLNRRFAAVPPATPAVVLRQAIWFGVYAATLAWLQIAGVLTLSLGLLLGGGLLMIEWLLHLREKAQWKP